MKRFEWAVGLILFSKTLTQDCFSISHCQSVQRHKKHGIAWGARISDFWLQADRLIQQSLVSLKICGNRIYWDSGKSGLTFLWFWKSGNWQPAASPRFLRSMLQKLHELRKSKGVNWNGRDLIAWCSYFGTMMVFLGEAEGWCQGQFPYYAAYDRPAWQICKNQAGFRPVFLCFYVLPIRVQFLGLLWCHKLVLRQLADIAYFRLLSQH